MPNVSIPVEGGALPAFLALPAADAGKAPGLVLLMEVYGVNRFMRAIAEHWAAQGFVVAVPGLYWRTGDVELDPETPGHREQALAKRESLDEAKAVDDVVATIDWLARHEACSGRVASQGYCLGGLLAFLASRRGAGAAHVSYYGVGIEKHLDHVGDLARPLLLHVGGADPWTPEPVQDALRERLLPQPGVEMYLYHGTGHAFARRGASSEVPEARALADGRSLAFLRRHLTTD